MRGLSKRARVEISVRSQGCKVRTRASDDNSNEPMQCALLSRNKACSIRVMSACLPPGRPERLPAQAPLRTVLESFPSHGSSLSMDIALCGMSRLGKPVARSALDLIQPLPYSSRADLLGNPYAGPETHQSTGVDRHLLFSVRTVPSSF